MTENKSTTNPTEESKELLLIAMRGEVIRLNKLITEKNREKVRAFILTCYRELNTTFRL